MNKSLLSLLVFSFIFYKTPAQPVATVNPASFTVNLNCNDTVTQTLIIGNTGNANLDFALWDRQTSFNKGYVLNYSSDNMNVVDLNSNTFLSGLLPSGDGPYFGTVHPYGDRVYITDYNSSTVRVLRTSDNSFITDISLGANVWPNGIAITPDGKYCYTANSNSSVSKIDCSTNTLVSTYFSWLSNAQDVAVTPDGNYLYVSDVGMDAVVVYNVNTNAYITSITGITNPYFLAASPDGKYIYASESNGVSSYLRFIDPSTNTLNASVGPFSNCYGLDVTPDGKYVYLLNGGNNRVEIINTTTQTISGNISDPSIGGAYDLIISPKGDYCYVINWESPNVLVINTTTNAITTTLSTGGVDSYGMAALNSWAVWVSETNNSGSIAAGGSQNIQVKFNSTGLIAGTYTGIIYMISNDPVTPYKTIPCTLNVTGNPDINVPLAVSCSAFDTIQVSFYDTDTFTIQNFGCDTLFVTNITSSSNQFTVNSFPSFVLPFSSGEATISFTPVLSTGAKTATITVQNNDTDTTFCVEGFALADYDSISPASFNVTLNSCNDSITDTLTIYNQGVSDFIISLDNIDTVASISLNQVLSKLNQGYSSITNLVPSIYYFTDGDIGNNIGDGGNDMYDGGNYLSTNLGLNFNYSDNLIVSHAAMGSGGQYFTRKLPGLFVFSADISGVTYFETTGNNGADGSGAADTTRLTAERFGKTYKGFVKRVYNAGDPSINQIIIVEDVAGLSPTYSTNTNDGMHRLSGTNSLKRIYFLLYASSAGGYVNNSQTQDIFNKFLEIIEPSPVFFSANILADTINSGDSSKIAIEFKSVALASGEHTGFFTINTNDPGEPVINVPCTLTVIGSPSMALSDNCFSFGSKMAGSVTTDTLTVTNDGCDTLKLTSITKTLPHYSVASSLTVNPFSSATLIVTFAPLATGVFNDTIQITGNAGNASVCLSGTGVPAPTIGVSPAFLNVNITNCNDSATQTITIDNTGAANLNFTSLNGSGNLGPVFDFGYVCNSNSNNVNRFSTQTNTIVGGTIAVGSWPWRIAMRPDGQFAYVCNLNSSNLSVINTSTNTVTATLALGFQPGGICITGDSRYAYVGNYSGSGIVKIDLATNTVVVNISNANLVDVKDLALSPDGSKLYASSESSGISSINTTTDVVIATFPGNYGNQSIVLNNDGSRAYVSEVWYDRVRVLNTATMQSITTIGGFNNPQGIALSPDGNYIYVVDRFGQSLKKISLTTNQVVNTLTDTRLNNGWEVVLSNDDKFAYVSNTNPAVATEDVIIVDLSSFTIVKTLSTATGSRGMATLKNMTGPFTNSTPAGGTVTPGGSTNISIEFNALGLLSGVYNSTFYIYSNDPLNDTVAIPVTMNVIGTPDIAFGNGIVNYLGQPYLPVDSVMIGATNTDTFYVKNNGCDTLFISDINKTLSANILNDTDLFVLPYDSAKLTVTFTPDTVGNYYDSLTIYNNDNIDTIIYLFDYGAPPPSIVVNPDTFNISLGCNSTVNDTVTISNTGTADLIYTIDTADYAAYFDGSGDYINRNSPNLPIGGSAITVEAWIYPQGYSDPSYNGIVSWGNRFCTGFGFSLGIQNNGRPSFAGWCNDFVPTSGPTATLNAWNHIAVVLSGTSVTLYMNGQPIYGTVTTAQYFNSINLAIGCTDYPNRYFNGKIDEVRIWNVAKSQYEIVSNRYKPLKGNEPGLRGYWNFNKQNANDLSSYANNGTLNGNTTFQLAGTPVNSFYTLLSNLSGTVPPGNSVQVPVQFNSTGYLIGNYQDSMLINSNDPLNPIVEVPLYMSVSGFAQMNFTKNCMYLDSIMIYTSKTDSLYIKNTGCDTLKILNATTQTPEFSVLPLTGTVMPGDSMKMRITFSPLAVNTFNDTLKIFSNAGDSLLCLSGKSFDKPTIYINPDTFNVTLGCGDSTTVPMTVYNTGGNNLSFSINDFSGVPNPVFISDFEDGNFSEWTTGSCGFTYTVVNGASPEGSRHLNMSGGCNNHYQGLRYTFSAKTPKYASFWVKASGTTTLQGYFLLGDNPINNTIAWFYMRNNGTMGLAGGAADSYVPYVANQWYHVEYRDINFTAKTLDFYIDGVLIYNNYPFRTNLNSISSIHIYNYNSSNTFYDQVILGDGPFGQTWLTAIPDTGSSVPGDSDIVNLNFNASGLSIGQYAVDIAVYSNDPANDTVMVPCTLNVTGAGYIALSDTCLYLDSIMEYTTNADTFYIKNTGCDTLKVTGISSTAAEFSADITSANILLGDSARVIVTFSPSGTGNFSGTLTILNSDADTSICLSGKAYPKPEMIIVPDTFNISIACGDTLIDTMKIYNAGLHDLIYTIDTANYVVSLDGSGDYIRRTTPNLAPAGTVTVEAWIYPTAYNDVTYNGIVSWGNRACTGNGFLLSIQNNGRPSMATWCNDFVPSTGPTATLNQWNHIACVLNGKSVTLYMNGQPVSGTVSNNTDPIFNGTLNLAIGSTDFPGRYFTGKMDEVRVWNVARSQAEILSTMYIKLNGNEQGLKGYWNFDAQNANDKTSFGNNGTLMGNAVVVTKDNAFYQLQGNLTDTIIYNDSLSYPITFNAGTLNAGTYYDSIIVYSNDPLNPTVVIPTIVNVTGNPEIVLADTCLDLDSIMQNTINFDTFLVANTGCDTLFLDSAITSGAPFAYISKTDYILPGDTGNIVVSFNPSAVNTFAGTLFIYNDDADTSICLTGESFPQPVIAFNPDTILVTTVCADTVTVPLVIYNNGVGSPDLQWNMNYSNYAVNLDGTNDYVSVPSNTWFNYNTFTIEAWIYTRSYNSWSRIIDFGNGAANNNVLLALSNGVSGRVQYEVYNGGSSGGTILTPTAIPLNQWVHVAVVQNGNSVTIYKDGAVWASGTTAIPNNVVRNNNYIGRSNWGADAYANAIYDEVRIWSVAKTQQEILDDKNREISGSNLSVRGYWKFNEGTGTLANDNSTYNQDGTLTNGASYVLSTAPVNIPVTASSTSGAIPAGSSDTVNIAVTSTGLIIGTYNYNITVNSNDPLNSADSIPVILNVVGLPQLVVMDSCAVFDTIMEFTTAMDTVSLTNTGCDTLFVTLESSTNFYLDSISIDSIGGYILPGDTASIPVIFAPDSAGNFTGNITVNTNDIDTSICLSGYAFPRPVIDVIPDTIVATLACADTITLPLVIANLGLTNLNWAATASGGTIPSGYCAPSYGSLCSSGDYINNFTFNTLSKLNSGCNGQPNNYIFDQSITTTVYRGNTYNISMQSGGSWGQGFGVWIDYNRDGDYADAGEFVYASPSSGTGLYSSTITIPASATTGKTRMRVRCSYASTVSASQYCTNFSYGEVEEYYITIDGDFATITPTSGTTLSADSDTVNVTLVSTGLLIGQYNANIYINSNDPLNPQVVVPTILNVVGAPEISLSDSCNAFDTIIEFTSTIDTLYISNTGCDTLFVDGFVSPNFQVMDTSGVFGSTITGYLMPGDTLPIYFKFLPDSAGNFSGIISLTTNDADTTICLNGYALPRPEINIEPDTINAVISVCIDSVVIPVTIYNNGGTGLVWNASSSIQITDDFDPSTDNSVWSVNNGISNTDCGSVSGNALFFNDAGTRQAATYDLNTTGGGTISFYLKISGGTPATCEQADGGENVLLQYSNNGGTTWNTIVTYTPGSYNNFTNLNVPIPAVAKTSATRFRWAQTNHSGTCCDHWALDNISIISTNPNVIPNPAADTTISGDSTVVNVTIKDTSLSPGNYTFNLLVNSNDPLSPTATVVINLFIDSVPPAPPVVSDTAICFGQPTPALIATGDSIRWYSDAALTTMIFSGDTFITGQTAAGIYTYYVTETDTATGCQSQADTVVLSINNPPVKPAATDTTVCSSSTIPTLISSGTIVKWYTDAALTNLVFTGTNYNTGITAAGTYVYYVTDSLGGCAASPADTSTLQINNSATANAGTDSTICEATIVTLSGSFGGGASLFGWATSGTGTFDDDSILNATYTPSATDISSGSVTLTISTNDPDGVGPCPAVSDAMILAINQAATVNAGADSLICGDVIYTLQGTKGGSAATTTWTSSGTGLFNNASLLNANYTASAADIIAGSVSLVLTSNDPTGPCPAVTDTMVLTLNNPATVNAGSDATICSGSTYALNGSRGGGAVSSLWTSSGDGSFDNASSLTPVYTPGANDLTNGSAVLYITTDNPSGPCDAKADSMALTINSTPAVPSASDTTVCSDAIIPALTASGTFIKWYSDAVLATLVGTGNSFNTGQTNPGSYTYWLTDSTAACPAGAADSATLTINGAATVDAGLNDTICEGSTYTLNGNMGGSATSIVWTSSGNGTFNNGNLLSAIYTPGSNDITNGTVTLTITTNDPDAAGPCSMIIDSMKLKINPAALVNAGPDTTICQGNTVTLSGTMGGGSTSITWSTLGSGTFNNSALLTATYTPSAADATSGTVKLVIASNDPAGPCPSVTDTITLTINTAAVVSAGNDTTICSGQDHTLSGSFGGGATSILWSTSGDGNYDSTSLVNAIYTPGASDISGGSVILTITTNDPDGAGPCPVISDNMILSINSTPAAPVSADTVVCSDAAIPNLTASGTNIQWYSNAALTTLVGTGNSFSTGQSAPGSYKYWLTDSLTSCPSSAADSATLTINEAATVDAGANDTICEGNTYTLSATKGGSTSTTLWTSSGDGTFDNAASLTATYTPGSADITSGNVTLTISTNDPDAAGPCSAIADSMKLTINPAAVVSAGANDTICEGSAYTLSGSFGGGASSVAWTSTGDGNFNNANLVSAIYTPGANDITTGYVYLVLTTNDPSGPCVAVNDTMKLTINPAAFVDAGLNDTLCVGNTSALLASFSGSTSSINWTSSGDGSFNNAILLTAVYDPGTADETAGTVTLTITTNDPDGTGPCTANTDSMKIKINSAPAKPNSADTTICFGQTTPNLTAIGNVLQWYTDGALTNLVFTGSTFASGDSVSGTYNYYVTDSITSCPASAADTATLIINPIPAPPVSADTAICFGEATPYLVATGDSIRWYSDAGLSAPVNNGDTFASGNTAAGVYIYYATQTDLLNGCQGPSVTVTLTINAIPVAPTTADTAACFGDTTPDLVATGNNINWYSDAGLTTLEFSGDSFASGDTASGIYTYYATQTINNCESPADSSVLTINNIPAAPVGADTAICQGATVPDLNASGTNVVWYSDSVLMTQAGTGNSYSTGQTSSGTYTYYATQSVNNCESPSISLSLTIKPIPAAPATSADTAICLGNTTPTFTATGTNLQWYADAGLTIATGTGSSMTPADTAAGTYTYYVTDSLNDCGAGPASSVILTIDTLPIAPLATNASSCFGDSVPSLSASGTNIQWYSDAGLTTMVGTGNNFSTGDTAVGSYTYFATSFSAGCGESASDSAMITIFSLPVTPTTTDAENCVGSVTATLVATGNNVQWYSDSNLTLLAGSGNSFVSSDSLASTYTYFATQTDTVTGCVSYADSASLTINPLPAAPVSSDTTTVFGNPVPDLTATGTNVQWYSDSALAQLEGAGNSFASGDSAVGAYTYYVTQSDSATGCESPATTVTLTILPGAPSTLGATSCEGDSVPALLASGTNILWYANPALTILADSGNSFTSTDSIAGSYTYYATQTINGYESPASSATLTINSLPAAPQTSDTATCDNQAIPALAAIGTNINWYGDSALTNLLLSGSTFIPVDSTAGMFTYYATETQSGCEGPAATSTLTIIAAPPAPLASDSSTCYGNPVPDLYASGTNILWYSDSALTTFEFSGNTFTTGDTAAGSYPYFAVDTVNGCTSASTTVYLLISSPANAPLSAGTSNDPTCPGEATTLTVNGTLSTGTIWRWYNTTCGTGIEGTGDSVNVAPLSTTNYFVRAEGGCDTTACVTIAVNVTNTLSTAASGSFAGTDTVCSNNAVVLTANGGTLGTGAIWNWYINSCGGTAVGSGDSITISPAATSTYFIRAEGTCNSTACDSITITVADPAAPLAADETVCEGQIIPDLVAVGDNVNWYNDSALTNLVFSGDTFSTGNMAAGVYTYFATQTSNTGCEGPATTAILTINAIPATPATSDTIGCEGGNIPDLTAAGTFINWYNDSALTSLVASGDSFSTGQTITGTYTYYVTDSVTGCEGPASAVTLTINEIPFAPVTSSGSGCSGDSVASVFATGTNIQWYADSAQTVFVSSGDTLKPGLLPPGTYSYYATQTVNGCESPVDSSIVNVLASPAAPASSDESVCEGQAVPGLVATGMNINWYSDSLLTNNISGNDTLVTGNDSAGVYTYYATETQNGCVSISTAVTLTITAIPPAPASADQTACASGIIPDLTAIGINVNWYSDSALTNLVASGNNFSTGESAVGVYTYFVTDSLPGCVSNANTVTLTINAIPAAPVGSNVIVCQGSPVPDLTVSGTNIVWYSEPMLLIQVGTGNNLITEKTQVGSYAYYATQTVNGCTSPASIVNLVINTSPDVTLNAYFANINSGQSVTLIAYNATSYTWSPATWLNTTTNDTVISTPDTTITYTVIGTNNSGCSDTESVTVNVKPLEIEEITDKPFTLEVYPNPNRGLFEVRISNSYEFTNAELRVYNLLGEIVYQSVVGNGQSTAEISLYKSGSGVYYVQLVTEEGVLTKRVVVE